MWYQEHNKARGASIVMRSAQVLRFGYARQKQEAIGTYQHSVDGNAQNLGSLHITPCSAPLLMVVVSGTSESNKDAVCDL